MVRKRDWGVPLFLWAKVFCIATKSSSKVPHPDLPWLGIFGLGMKSSLCRILGEPQIILHSEWFGVISRLQLYARFLGEPQLCSESERFQMQMQMQLIYKCGSPAQSRSRQKKNLFSESIFLFVEESIHLCQPIKT